MKYLPILLGLLLAAMYFVDSKILTTREISSRESDEVGNSSDTVVNTNKSEPDLTNRFGFDVNKAQAHAYGPYGTYGASQAISYRNHAGIVGPANSYYRPLYQKTGSYSQTYRNGPGAPFTWTDTNSRAGGSSGFRGGYGGNAVASRYSAINRIPLGHGTTLLSNFKNNTTKDEEYLKNTQQPEDKESLPQMHFPQQPNSEAIAFPDKR